MSYSKCRKWEKSGWLLRNSSLRIQKKSQNLTSFNLIGNRTRENLVRFWNLRHPHVCPLCFLQSKVSDVGMLKYCGSFKKGRNQGTGNVGAALRMAEEQDKSRKTGGFHLRSCQGASQKKRLCTSWKRRHDVISGLISFDTREDEREKTRCLGKQQGPRSSVPIPFIKSDQERLQKAASAREGPICDTVK